MAVSYTITPEAYAEDGERSDTLHQCPLCGIAYDLTCHYRPHPRWWVSPFKYPAQIAFVEVNDDCNCHDKHVAEFGL